MSNLGLSSIGHDVLNACKEVLGIKQPTRLEVIDTAYTNWKVKDMELSYQDDGRTLKIFIKEME